MSVRVCPNDGTDLFLEADQIFADRYEFIEVLGTGGNGVIYKARHITLDKIVAIKLLHEFSGDPTTLMRFQREAKAASSLTHPNVITVFDFGIHNGTQPYMVMDYVQGDTLADILKAQGPTSIEMILDVMEPVAGALAHAHKKGILHRDLKPSNIMIVKDGFENGFVKLLDFGLAKLINADDLVSLSASGVAIGSPAYMSPEQATAHGVDHRSDLYSLGCVIFEMLIGRPPLLGDSPTETLVNRLHGIVPTLAEASGKKFAPDIEYLVARLLQREQHERFQSAVELLSALSSIRKRLNSQREALQSGFAEPSVKGQSASFGFETASTRKTVKDIKISDVDEARRTAFELPYPKMQPLLQGAVAGEHLDARMSASYMPGGWRQMPLGLRIFMVLLAVLVMMACLKVLLNL